MRPRRPSPSTGPAAASPTAHGAAIWPRPTRSATCMPTATGRGRSGGRSSCGPREPRSPRGSTRSDISGGARSWRATSGAPCWRGARPRRDTAAAGRTWPLGEVLRSLAGALELQGRWEDALAAREQAASAFAAGALPGDAAGERLAAATHLRSAASFRAALALLETAKAEATPHGGPTSRRASWGSRATCARDGRGRARDRARAQGSHARPRSQPQRRRGRDLPAAGRLARARR